MELTDRVHYLITEYNLNVGPVVVQATAYLNVIKTIEDTDYSTKFNDLPENVRDGVIAEMQAAQDEVLASVKANVKALCQRLISRGTSLVVQQGDHVTDMSSNVDANATIDGLNAVVDSMNSAVEGMAVITSVSGGAPGAALVASLVTEPTGELSAADAAKVAQVAAVAGDLIQLGLIANQLTNFVDLLAEVIP